MLSLLSDAELDVVDRSKCGNCAVSACCGKLSYLLDSRVSCSKDAFNVSLAVLACFDVSALQSYKILEVSSLRLLADRNEKSVYVYRLLAAVFPVRKFNAGKLGLTKK